MKLTLINCYFGVLPDYFQMWLKSCGFNKQVDFLFFTDANLDAYDVPDNVHVKRLSWEELIGYISERFDFEICISEPYKLTDFKPAYGYIFDEFLKDSDYWGYCDVDLIFGDILKFLFPRMNEKYEKIYCLGHLTVYENSKDMKYLFKQGGGAFDYKTVFSNKEFYSFDEHAGMISISKEAKVNSFCQEDMADISCRVKRMTVSRQRNYDYQVFYYENGSVYRAYILNDGVICDEYIYIHFQKRNISFNQLYDSFYLTSNRIINKIETGVPSNTKIRELSEFISEKNDRKQLLIYKINKLIQFAKSSIKEKNIWIRIKLWEMNYDKSK